MTQDTHGVSGALLPTWSRGIKSIGEVSVVRYCHTGWQRFAYLDHMQVLETLAVPTCLKEGYEDLTSYPAGSGLHELALVQPILDL